MSIRARVVFYTLLYGLVFLLLVIFFSDFAFPPAASPDNRLQYARNGDQALSFNNVVLAHASRHGWLDVELAYRLEEGEVLHFLFHRDKDDFLDFRLSRSLEFDDALLTFRDGRIATKQSLADRMLPDSGRVRFGQNDNLFSIAVDDRNVLSVPHSGVVGTFEIVLMPQQSNRIFQRVSVVRETLISGVASPRSFWPSRLHSVFAMAIFAGALLALLMLWLRRRLAQWVSAGSYRPVLMFLLCLDLILTFVAAYFHRVFLDLASPNFPANFVFKSMVLVFLATAFLLIGFLVRRMVRPLENGRRRLINRAFFTPVALLVLAVIVVMLSFKFLMSVARKPEMNVTPRADNAPPRILCYGGSSTAGFPFPRDWPHTYPLRMREILRHELDPSAEVLNLGVNAKKIPYIYSRIKEDLPKLRASHVIVNSVQNNRDLGDDLVREQLTQIIELCRQHKVRPVLVLEPSFDLICPGLNVRDKNRKYRTLIEAKYELLRRFAQEQDVLLIDPNALFRARKDEFLFLDGNVHLTKYGHALMAQALTDGLFPPVM